MKAPAATGQPATQQALRHPASSQPPSQPPVRALCGRRVDILLREGCRINASLYCSAVMLSWLGSLYFHLRLLLHVAMNVAMITVLGYGPNSWRRSILKREYEGEALEARLQMKISGGWPMVKALYHMGSVNLRPAFAVGDSCPRDGVPIVPIASASAPPIELLSLCREGVPLVLNFGSCS